jgi:hypothetical protein
LFFALSLHISVFAAVCHSQSFSYQFWARCAGDKHDLRSLALSSCLLFSRSVPTAHGVR